MPGDLAMELAVAWRTDTASPGTTPFVETAIEVARDLYSTLNQARPHFTETAP